MPTQPTARRDYLHSTPGLGWLPNIERPNFAESMIPVVGPTWEALADLQDGDLGGAALNGLMAVADVAPGGLVAVRGARMAAKGVGVLKKGSLTANASQKMMRRKLDLVGKQVDVHHTVPLNGTPRNVADWRNHNLFLKVLPREQHVRLSSRYNVPGTDIWKNEYDTARKLWYGTTDWQKAVAANLADRAVGAAEHLRQKSNSKR